MDNPQLHMLHSMDTQACVKRNRRDTFVVIFLLTLTYALLGFLGDLIFFGNTLKTGHFIPYMTLAGVGLALAVSVGALMTSGQFLLQGSEYQVVSRSESNPATTNRLLDVVEEMTLAAGLSYPIKVYLQSKVQPNAFSSGYNEQNAIIVVSQGLLDLLNREELAAVIAHELSHIRNQDTRVVLVVSVVCHFLIAILDGLLSMIMQMVISEKSNDDSAQDATSVLMNLLIKGIFLALIFGLRMCLPFMNILILAFLSKKREQMADAGCVELMRNNLPLGNALFKIDANQQAHSADYQKLNRDTPHEDLRRLAYFYDPLEADALGIKSGYNYFSTHVGLAQRVANIGLSEPTGAQK